MPSTPQAKAKTKLYTFPKKDHVNLRLKSVLVYRTFRITAVIYCLWNHTSPKPCTWCQLSGLGTRLKAFFPQGSTESRAYGLHVWGLLGLAVAAEEAQPANPALPVVTRELIALEAKGSLRPQSAMGFRSWRTVNLPLPRVLQRGGQRSLPQAHCECSWASEPSGQYQRLTPASAGRSEDDANTASSHCLPGQTSASSLLERLGVPASYEPLAFYLLLILPLPMAQVNFTDQSITSTWQQWQSWKE